MFVQKLDNPKRKIITTIIIEESLEGCSKEYSIDIKTQNTPIESIVVSIYGGKVINKKFTFFIYLNCESVNSKLKLSSLEKGMITDLQIIDLSEFTKN